MSYRCRVCGEPSPRGQPLRKHVIYKHTRPVQIASEVPVCAECELALRRGTPLDVLANLKRIEAMPPEPQPVPVSDLAVVPKPVAW